jgi:hypothetical protein
VADRLDRSGLDQLPQFLGSIRVFPAPDGDTDQKGARRLLLAP